MTLRSSLALALLLASCTTSPPSEPVSDDLLLALAEIDGLVRWHEDVLLVCDQPRGEQRPPCEVRLIGSDGTVRSSDVGPALAAERLSGDRLVILRPDRRLVIREASGDETQISASAFDPRVTSDGGRVLFREAENRPAPETSELIEVDASSLERRVVSTDPRASTAFDVPGGRRVLFVSTRTGLASLFVAEPDGTDRQITNVGMTSVTPDFVPVPVRQLVWTEDGGAFVFTAHLGGVDRIYRVSVDGEDSYELGEGRFPVALGGDRVKALGRTESGEPLVVRYPVERAP